MITLFETREASLVAEHLTGRDHISFSSISSFQRCPLAWKFRYVDGLPEEAASASLVLGGAIHCAAEFHYNELMAGNPAPDLDSLLSVFWESWRDRGEQATITFGKGEDVNSIGQTADRILTAFQQSDLADPEGEIIGVEETLKGELSPDVPDLLARIDLMVETDDALTITDLKTARSRWSARQAEDSGEQLLMYAELARQLIPNKEIRLEFAVITKAKEPVVERLPVTPDPHRTARTKQVVEHVWRAIESGVCFPCPSPISCGSCSYRDPCRQWAG